MTRGSARWRRRQVGRPSSVAVPRRSHVGRGGRGAHAAFPMACAVPLCPQGWLPATVHSFCNGLLWWRYWVLPRRGSRALRVGGRSPRLLLFFFFIPAFVPFVFSPLPLSLPAVCIIVTFCFDERPCSCSAVSTFPPTASSCMFARVAGSPPTVRRVSVATSVRQRRGCNLQFMGAHATHRLPTGCPLCVSCTARPGQRRQSPPGAPLVQQPAAQPYT